MTNGIELDVFAVKDGLRYKVNTISINDVSKILTDSIMDGIGKVIGIDNKGEENNEHSNNM